MFIALRKLLFAFLSFVLICPALGQKNIPPNNPDLDHIREELGINQFTAPSIGLLFDELAALQPIPFDKVWRNLPDTIPQDRPRIALNAGQVIADGFLAVTARKQSRIESVSRHLLKLARGLGVGEHVTKHSKGLLEFVVRERWDDAKKELTKAQGEVEAGMMALKDEELAHLVSLGGWLRGLEITATVVTQNYAPARARTLVQPELLDYFRDRVSTLNPHLKQTAVIGTITRNLEAIQKIITKRGEMPIELSDVKEIRELAREMNLAISTPEP